MPAIELTEDEAGTLRDVLTSYLGDLRAEIADTEDQEFRNSLKRTEAVLVGVIGRLRPATPR